MTEWSKPQEAADRLLKVIEAHPGFRDVDVFSHKLEADALQVNFSTDTGRWGTVFGIATVDCLGGDEIVDAACRRAVQISDDPGDVLAGHQKPGTDNEFNQYQQQALTTVVYRQEIRDAAPCDGAVYDQCIAYAFLGLANEAGEACGALKKYLRADEGMTALQLRNKVRGELGDVLWYLAVAANEANLTLSEIARENLNKLSRRKAAGTLKGSGDDR